jgi:hypothetical protein
MSAFESSSWLQASNVWLAAMAAGCHGKGKTFGTPTLLRFGSVMGLTWCMDNNMDRPPPPPPPLTTLEGFGSVKGNSKGIGSVMDQGKGQGFDHQPTLESLDYSHDDYGEGQGKGHSRELYESWRGIVWPEATNKGKGKCFGKPTLAELLDEESFLAYQDENSLLSMDDADDSKGKDTARQ